MRKEIQTSRLPAPLRKPLYFPLFPTSSCQIVPRILARLPWRFFAYSIISQKPGACDTCLSSPGYLMDRVGIALRDMHCTKHSARINIRVSCSDAPRSQGAPLAQCTVQVGRARARRQRVGFLNWYTYYNKGRGLLARQVGAIKKCDTVLYCTVTSAGGAK